MSFDKAERLLSELADELTRLRAQTLPGLFAEEEKPARWTPAYDYLAGWNDACMFRDWSKGIRTISTPRRKAHLRAREQEPAFDWPAIFEEILIVNEEWVSGFAGFSFDWIISNQDNYTKLLEGKYRDPALARQAESSAKCHNPPATETNPDAPAST